MNTFNVVVHVVHVVSAAIWLGAAFFVGWFLMPAIRGTGHHGSTVLAAIQKRGWVAFVPMIATLTVLSGFWLYRPYMGESSHAAALFGYGGVVGIAALALGGVGVSRSLINANGLVAQADAMPEGPDRAAVMASAGQLRQRALTYARIVSLLLILAAAIMTMASDA